MNDINWVNCQEESDKILSDGVYFLKSRPAGEHRLVTSRTAGNYLITNSGASYYVGEAKELSSRIKQQFREQTSTFYKNYLKYCQTNHVSRVLRISEFSVQFMETSFGRKEIEEFGIVNLPTSLNKFQLGKRRRMPLQAANGLWEAVQTMSESLIVQGREVCLQQPVFKWHDAAVPQVAGIYLVRNPERQLIYLGESSDINERHKTHSGTTYFSALRRHVGTEIFGFQFIGKKKFSEDDDARVSQFLGTCTIAWKAVQLGRYELEEYLIRTERPLLNRKDNDDL